MKLSIPDICTILLFNTMEHFFLSKESANSHNTISGKNSSCKKKNNIQSLTNIFLIMGRIIYEEKNLFFYPGKDYF